MIEVQVVDRSWSNEWGPEITTLQLRYPRFLLAQLNTHRVFSRSTASSRAIPVSKSIARVESGAYVPGQWGSNRPGMQSTEELGEEARAEAERAWHDSLEQAIRSARKLEEVGVHKQWANRILEPFSYAETVVTSTSWDWFFELRCHKDTQPEMQVLAGMMRDAVNNGKDDIAWRKSVHLPYVTTEECVREGLNAFQAMMVSAARCARVSYLNHDRSHPDVGKDIDMANRLWEDKHLSPFEHTAVVAQGERMGNLKGWCSLRTMMERGVGCTEEDLKKGIEEAVSMGVVPTWV